MSSFTLHPVAFGALCLLAASVHAQVPPDPPNASRLDRIQITATRFDDAVQAVPQSITVISGDELRARHASDLRTALALVGGVNVAPGGDQGPAGAVPGLLGLREVDDFLLLVDGAPAGGAFIPHFETISLTNVERIEVLRGSAPVYFGTTAFAGTINIVHYAAGTADKTITATVGSFGSLGLRGATVLSDGSDGLGIRQSISGEFTRDHYSDPRAGTKRGQLLYRAATDLAGGALRLDLGATVQHQKPDSPVPIGDDGQLTKDLPIDFNQNPADAKIDTNRVQATLAYDRKLAIGDWGSLLTFTRSRTHSIRGFLIEDFEDADPDAANASGYGQVLHTSDLFLDTHLTSRVTDALAVTYGLNELYGHAREDSQRFRYTAPLDGSLPPASADMRQRGRSTLDDTRSFFGAYAQAKLTLGDDASLLAGLRWNHTRETRDIRSPTDPDDPDDNTSARQHNNRWSGTFGGQLRVWHDPQAALDDVTLHASIGNTFQPPQIDFGPEPGEEPLLKPETMRSVEAGIKADGFDGRLDVDLTAFVADFRNQAVATQVDGSPVLVAGGTERFKGVEIEGAYRFTPDFSLAAHASWNDARYRDFTTTIDGTDTQLAGKRLVMSPLGLGGAGLVYAPRLGWRASVTANAVGRRALDMRNTQSAGSYVISDASVGYRFAAATVSLSATNLGNRRDPVLQSELGDGQFYRLQGRRVFVSLTTDL